MTNLSPAFEAELSSVYAECLDQIRIISALDPTKAVVDWDQYTCTCAHEFAYDLAVAWNEHVDDGNDAVRVLGVIKSQFPGWLRDRDSSRPSWLITYGLISFGKILECVEAIRDGRFDPSHPVGIRP